MIIETSNVSLETAATPTQIGSRSGDFVQLLVSDTGGGMDEETCSHIFEPFFTTKPHDKGTGLGLATVQGIVSQNEGFVTVHSKEGIGTTFAIHLPRYDESHAEAPQPDPAQA